MDNATELLTFTCPSCAARYPINWRLAGKTLHCKSCGQIVAAEPERLVIPAKTLDEAARQLGEALNEAVALQAAAQSLLAQYARQEEKSLAEQTEALKAKMAARDEEALNMNARLADLNARLAEAGTENAALKSRLEAQESRLFELAGELKGREEQLQAVQKKETLLKSLFEAVEGNLKKDIDAHQHLLSTLRQQLKFG